MNYYQDQNGIIYYEGDDCIYKWQSGEKYCDVCSEKFESLEQISTIYTYLNGEYNNYPAIQYEKTVRITFNVEDEPKSQLLYKIHVGSIHREMLMAFDRETLMVMIEQKYGKRHKRIRLNWWERFQRRLR